MAKNNNPSVNRNAGNRPAVLASVIKGGLRWCEGCNALSSFDGDECLMCRLRDGPIERPK